MNVTYKINGRAVSEQQFKQRTDPVLLEEILATRRCPACVTNDTFMAGRKLNGAQFKTQAEYEIYSRELRAKGGSTAGKFYSHKLATRVGDPQAWIGSSSDVRRVLLERGDSGGCAGVKVQRNRDCLGEEPEYGIADDIIDREVEAKLSQNPELAPTPKERARFRAELKQKRQPHYANDGQPKRKPKKKLLSLGSKGE